MFTDLMPPKPIHVPCDIDPEEINIIYRCCGPIYHDGSIRTCMRVNGDVYVLPAPSLAPEMAKVRGVSRPPGSRWAPLDSATALKLLPDILMS